MITYGLTGTYDVWIGLHVFRLNKDQMSCHKEYMWHKKGLPVTTYKLRPRYETQSQTFLYGQNGIIKRNTQGKYEQPPSKVEKKLLLWKFFQK